MRIWAKRRYRFVTGNDHSDFFETRPGEFQEAPDWISKTRLYQWALNDESIRELESGVSVAVDLSGKVERARNKRQTIIGPSDENTEQTDSESADK